MVLYSLSFLSLDFKLFDDVAFWIEGKEVEKSEDGVRFEVDEETSELAVERDVCVVVFRVYFVDLKDVNVDEFVVVLVATGDEMGKRKVLVDLNVIVQIDVFKSKEGFEWGWFLFCF